MKHITVQGFDTKPCNGAIEKIAITPSAAPRPPRSLPILGLSTTPPANALWRCQRCGHEWAREPLLDEAL